MPVPVRLPLTRACLLNNTPRAASACAEKDQTVQAGQRLPPESDVLSHGHGPTWNLQVKAFYERLVAAGKPKTVALAAAMRKLLMIAVGVLRSGKSFDPNWSQKVVAVKQTVTATAT